VIAIVRQVLDDVVAHARDESPRECCGVLVGTRERVLQSVRALNLAQGQSRFQIDPRDHIRAIRDARARSLDVVGFYHSHPRSRAYPSETDIAESGYAGAMHLIAGLGGSETDVRLFTIDGATVVELPFAVEGIGD
jgi:[CysO sulfur-carrier protein]-S-L-cysteine hydrolase